LTLVLTEACNKKRPPLPLQAQAPTITPTLPEEIPEVTASQLPPPPKVPTATEQANKPQKKPAKVAKKKTPPLANTTAAAAQPPVQSAPQNNETVASLRPPHNPAAEPAPDLTVAAAISSKDANRQKEETAHMVDTTEAALKNLTRQLNEEEKAMRTQIETYLQQSRKATADSDYERAFNLAKKAQVLADALIKQ